MLNGTRFFTITILCISSSLVLFHRILKTFWVKNLRDFLNLKYPQNRTMR